VTGSGIRDDLRASIEGTLLDQARRNELIIAYVRAVSISLVAVGDWLAHVSPPALVGRYPVRIPLFTTVWGVFAIALAVVLRRGFYRPSLRTILPAVDGLTVGAGVFNLAHAFGPEDFKRVNGPTTLAMACGLLAATGALRLTRRSASVTGGFAIAIFVAISLGFDAWTAVSPIHVALLFGMALLSIWMTDNVRRAMQSEVGRATFERFLPTHVVDQAYGAGTRAGTGPLIDLLTEPRSIDATILITDLRGFTSMSETMTPAASLAFLNEIQGFLANIVRENGGTVDKFLGDGMLAVFGAPEPLPDHATRALSAAQAMRVKLAAFNASRAATGEKTVKLGIGIHSGPVVTGCLGTGRRLEFTVIGDTVNTTSRLESLTKEKGAEVLFSEETRSRVPAADRARILESDAGFVPVGEVPIRGRKGPLFLHALMDPDRAVGSAA
jgi:adenylate cyclase